MPRLAVLGHATGRGAVSVTSRDDVEEAHRRGHDAVPGDVTLAAVARGGRGVAAAKLGPAMRATLAYTSARILLFTAALGLL